jgi:hypothetical protein
MNPYDPVKCPDCNTWWRGYEHRCPPSLPNVITTATPIWQRQYPSVWVSTGGGGASGVISVTMPPNMVIVNRDEEPPDESPVGAVV